MDDQVAVLRAKYDALIRARRDIRDAVRAEYKEKIKDEIDRRILEIDRKFAEELSAAKAAGMRRSEMAEAIRTNDFKRMQYFLNLTGDTGFQRGRPAISSRDKLKPVYEILDAVKGLVRINKVGRHMFDEPVTGLLRWHGGVVYQLESYEGSDVSEWEMAINSLRGSDAYKKEIYGVYVELREELERSGWVQNWRPGLEETEERYVGDEISGMFGDAFK